MNALNSRHLSILLVIFCLLSPQAVRGELLAASGATKVVELQPLQNSTSALSLVWPIGHPTQNRVAAVKARISTIVSGGTTSRSSYEIESFLKLKGVEQHVDFSGQNLILTVSAPNEVFPETLIHLENLLLEPEYSSEWYARELETFRLTHSTITRRPSDVLAEIADFLEHERGDTANGLNDGDIRFGRPTQAIVRSVDQEVKRRINRLINKMPTAKTKWKLPLAKWIGALTDESKEKFTLPKGIVHFADLDSSEMLILIVSAKEYRDETDQLGANVLVDYIGANQGSEMFRIIRQKMRAAYDPRSDFIVMGKNKALISISATVEALEWPKIYNKINDIYESVRSGFVEQDSLEIQLDSLGRVYYYYFFNNPVWAVRQYIHEHPSGANDIVNIPLFGAFGTVSTEEIVESSRELLPAFEDFLVILIGGGASPKDSLRSKGYCALPKNTPLRYCLEVLSNAENL
ncbi:hypothetical protein ROA7450_02828 [Roseovarius albus]|uniref:Peptidase M16 C-terminal domain-containing protein n=1 Tax=Roseovarius albus TaxID=1247867 RepID=A0A1X6ZL00_9RHOB|nr:insulinase family protein [Roseovarius albus]SLN54948.1 hypothetical protein ROA7450_02828 [Roseovarius albus]